MYKVAVSAQNAEQVKMVSFDGSLGYLHNGLYRDPHLPDILKWENSSLIVLKVIIFWLGNCESHHVIISPLQEVCAVMQERRLRQKSRATFQMKSTNFISLYCLFCLHSCMFWINMSSIVKLFRLIYGTLWFEMG